MTYRVEISPRALRDAATVYEYIRQASPRAAGAWFSGLIDAVDSLKRMPERYPVAMDEPSAGIALRRMPYGKSPHVTLVFYEVDGDGSPPVVRIHTIRHGACRPPMP